MDHRSASGSLHRLFQMVVVVKGFDGVLEFIGGLLLVLLSPVALHNLVIALTQHDLAEEPDDWLVFMLRRLAEGLSVETRHFASAYLIGHGVLKIFLAASLLRERLWAFPLALFVLAIFVTYQLHRFGRTHSTVLLGLTVLDAVLMVLIWREYRTRTEIVRLSTTATPTRPVRRDHWFIPAGEDAISIEAANAYFVRFGSKPAVRAAFDALVDPLIGSGRMTLNIGGSRSGSRM